MRDQLEREARDAGEVKSLLDNKYLKEAFGAAEKSILEQMDEVSLRDTDMHTRLILARKTLFAVKHYLESMIQTGEMANLQLREPNKFRNLFNR